MYDMCFCFAKFLLKHRWLYYLLGYTWNGLMALVGLVISLALLPFVRPSKWQWIYCFKLKKAWGGVNFGMMFLRDTTSWDRLSMHEFGHTFQNCLFGPFVLFIVSIPSGIRYWYRRLKYERKGLIPPTNYDDIWFEKSATDIGQYADEFLKK